MKMAGTGTIDDVRIYSRALSAEEVAVLAGGNSAYDGLNRRIVHAERDYYYNTSWQTLEVRTNGDADPLKQYVWDLRYIDAPVLRWRDGNTDGDYLDAEDDTLYSLNDANMNPPSPAGSGETGVTAVVDGSDGDVVERYAYDPYGKVTVLNGEDDADGGGVSDWSADADNESDWDNRIGYCGYRLDPETGANGQGLRHVRNRVYETPLGRWTSRDPLNQDESGGGYHDGMGLYEYVLSEPAGLLDGAGLQAAESEASLLRQATTFVREAQAEIEREFSESLATYLAERVPELRAALAACMRECGDPNAEIESVAGAYDAIEEALIGTANEQIGGIANARDESTEAIADAPVLSRIILEEMLTWYASKVVKPVKAAALIGKTGRRVRRAHKVMKHGKEVVGHAQDFHAMLRSARAGGKLLYGSDQAKQRDIDAVQRLADRIVADIKDGVRDARAQAQAHVKADVAAIAERYNGCIQCCRLKSKRGLGGEAEAWWARRIPNMDAKLRAMYQESRFAGRLDIEIPTHYDMNEDVYGPEPMFYDEMEAPHVPGTIVFPDDTRRRFERMLWRGMK